MNCFKCKMCGGTIEFEQGATVGVCDSCGTKQTLPRLDDDKKANLYDRANHFRRNNEYDKAMAIYEQILNEDNTDAETYWSLVLCRYGIEYVEDPATAKRVPTVNRAQFTSVLADEDYKSAIANADMAQRILYEDEAKAIDEIQKGILEISQKEEPFDVFICYKETDSNGRRTQDSVLANDLYHQLTQEGFKVFFARITLEDKLGTAYEPYIFAALNSAKVMVVLGTKSEYFNAVWVKNEWSRYLALIKNGAKKMLIPAYRDMDPYDLPEEFSHLQAQDMSKLGFMQDLIRGIKKILDAEKEKETVKETVRETVVVSGGTAASAGIEPLLKRVFMFLEDGDWNNANEYCEKVLDQDPENARAYLGKLMAELYVKKQEELKNCEKPFDELQNYQKIKRFGDSALIEKLEKDNQFIRERNEEARLSELYETAWAAMKEAETEKEYLSAAKDFDEIKAYRDSAALAKQCREKAAEFKQESENVYSQLIEIMKNAGKFETTQSKLDAEKQKKVDLEKTLQTQLRQLGEDKNTIMCKTVELSEKKEKLQALRLEKSRVDDDISASKNQLVSLGIFAISKKKELNQKIGQLTTETCRLANEIEDLQKRIDMFSAVVNLQTADEEITRLETKLAEELNSGIRKPSLSEIANEIVEEEYILDYIKSDREKLETLKGFSNLLVKIGIHLDIPIFFGTYPQGTDGKMMPIEWKVLDKDNRKVLLISKFALDCQKYNSSFTDITWEKSTLRTWLNGTFLNSAFSADEKAKIVTTNVSTDKNPRFNTEPGNATTDNVFLLSTTEAEKYFSSDSARQCSATAYAKAQGAYTDTDNGNCWWWLRSPGSTQDGAACVYGDGSVYYRGDYVSRGNGCVRPALWINLDS